jgi:hypothetical protein
VKLTKVRKPNVQASVTRSSPAGGLPGIKIKFLVLGLLSAFVAAKASTIPLPATHYTVDFSFNLSSGVVGPTTFQGNEPIDKFWNAGGLIGETQATVHRASISLGGSVSLIGLSGLGGDAAVSYFVYLAPLTFAPLDINQVPVITHVMGSTNCTPKSGQMWSVGGDAVAQVVIGDPAAPMFQHKVVCSDIGDGLSNTFDLSKPLLFGVGKSTPVLVSVRSEASAAVLEGVAPFDFTAFADSTFQIDPSFPFANDYQIIVSPDGATSGIPEPATYATLACGLAGILVCRAWRGRARLGARQE